MLVVTRRGVLRERDNQKMRVYRSEWAASSCLPPELSLSGRVPDAQRLVERVSKWREFREMSPRIQRVAARQSWSDILYIDRDYNGRVWSRGGGRWLPVTRAGKTVHRPAIHIAKPHLKDLLLVLHECAHWCGERDVAAHGPEFSYAMLALTKKFASQDVHDVLADEYEKRGVEASW